jgi:hypothetical protein
MHIVRSVLLLGALTTISAVHGRAFTPTVNDDQGFWSYDVSTSDEFDVTGALSASKWTQELGEWKGECGWVALSVLSVLQLLLGGDLLCGVISK